MNNTRIAILLFIFLVIGGGLGYWLASGQQTSDHQTMSKGENDVLFWRNPMNPTITSPVFMKDEMGMDYLPVYADSAKPKEKKVLYWRNPMNPAITSPVFTKDEMGMDYLPVYADGGNEEEVTGTVTIDPVTVQNIGVRIATVERRTLSRELNALGRITFNEEKLARLHPKISGWIETLNVDETGTQVNRDSILMSIYSPDLVSAQREYVVALKNWESVKTNGSAAMKDSAKTILSSAKERLELFDVPEHQIRELETSRKPKKHLHIHSPFSGRIMNIGVREGQYVTPKDELYLIADLNRIWVYVDVYEDELPWIKLGDSAQMRVRAVPGKTFNGKVTFIYPTLSSKTRTIRVRLEFDNVDLLLKPGMFANVLLKVDHQNNVIVVPAEAIVRSGPREQVFVVREPGKFVPKEVTVGFSASGFTQVVSGLEAGEIVVTSSQFLIDSESKLREATAKMMEAMSSTEQNDMSDMKMDDMSMDDMKMDDMDMSDMSMDAMDSNNKAQ